jgi:hypothetical protein
MSLTDILGGVGIVAGAAGVFYLIDKYYIPFANEFQKECDKEEKEAGDDYKFSNDKGEKK